MRNNFTLEHISTHSRLYLSSTLDRIFKNTSATEKAKLLSELHSIYEKDFYCDSELPESFDDGWLELCELFKRAKKSPAEYITALKSEVHPSDIALNHHFLHYILMTEFYKLYIDLEEKEDTLTFTKTWFEEKVDRIFALFDSDFTYKADEDVNTTWLYVIEEIQVRGINNNKLSTILDKYKEKPTVYFKNLMNQILPLTIDRSFTLVKHYTSIHKCFTECDIKEGTTLTQFNQQLLWSIEKASEQPVTGSDEQQLLQHLRQRQLLIDTMALYPYMPEELQASLIPWTFQFSNANTNEIERVRAYISRKRYKIAFIGFLAVAAEVALGCLTNIAALNYVDLDYLLDTPYTPLIIGTIPGLFFLAPVALTVIFAFNKFEKYVDLLKKPIEKVYAPRQFFDLRRKKTKEITLLTSNEPGDAEKFNIIISETGQQIIKGGYSTYDEMKDVPLNKLKHIVSAAGLRILTKGQFTFSDLSSFSESALPVIITPEASSAIEAGLFFVDRTYKHQPTSTPEFRFK